MTSLSAYNIEKNPSRDFERLLWFCIIELYIGDFRRCRWVHANDSFESVALTSLFLCVSHTYKYIIKFSITYPWVADSEWNDPSIQILRFRLAKVCQVGESWWQQDAWYKSRSVWPVHKLGRWWWRWSCSSSSTNVIDDDVDEAAPPRQQCHGWWHFSFITYKTYTCSCKDSKCQFCMLFTKKFPFQKQVRGWCKVVCGGGSGPGWTSTYTGTFTFLSKDLLKLIMNWENVKFGLRKTMI